MRRQAGCALVEQPVRALLRQYSHVHERATEVLDSRSECCTVEVSAVHQPAEDWRIGIREERWIVAVALHVSERRYTNSQYSSESDCVNLWGHPERHRGPALPALHPGAAEECPERFAGSDNERVRVERCGIGRVGIERGSCCFDTRHCNQPCKFEHGSGSSGMIPRQRWTDRCNAAERQSFLSGDGITPASLRSRRRRQAAV